MKADILKTIKYDILACPHCNDNIGVSCDWIIDDGNDADEMNTQLTLHKREVLK